MLLNLECICFFSSITVRFLKPRLSWMVRGLLWWVANITRNVLFQFDWMHKERYSPTLWCVVRQMKVTWRSRYWYCLLQSSSTVPGCFWFQNTSRLHLNETFTPGMICLQLYFSHHLWLFSFKPSAEQTGCCQSFPWLVHILNYTFVNWPWTLTPTALCTVHH